MLVLPQRHNYRILMPIPKTDWRSPSAAQPKDPFGRENCVRHSVTARTNTGEVFWRGWFDDREDFDVFVHALALRTLKAQRPLWSLPTPNWLGDFDNLPLFYAVTSYVFKTTPTGSNQTSTSPKDWDNSHNAIETIGAGGSGGATSAAGSGVIGSGAGGGAWNGLGNHASLGANFSFAVPGTTTYVWQVGVGGIAKTNAAGGGTAGADGGDSWFNGTTLAGSSCGSKGGIKGAVVTTPPGNGGAGGTGASGVGTSSKNGGRGGNITNAGVANGGSGGGGAGGSTAIGGQGTDSAATGVVQTAGGQGDPAVGGAGGAAGQNNGVAGTEIDSSTTGSGGGGGGRAAAGTVTAGSGAVYGGGGGGCCSTSSVSATSGAGAVGLVALIYTPFIGGFFIMFQ